MKGVEQPLGFTVTELISGKHSGFLGYADGFSHCSEKIRLDRGL